MYSWTSYSRQLLYNTFKKSLYRLFIHSIVFFLLSFSLSSERDRELMQYRRQLGSGPSSNRCLNGTTHSTHDLSSYHTAALVYLFFRTCFIYWSPKAGIAGARIEFGVGGK